MKNITRHDNQHMVHGRIDFFSSFPTLLVPVGIWQASAEWSSHPPVAIN
jgi:hypothetical protein